jgi:hypothetical protein
MALPLESIPTVTEEAPPPPPNPPLRQNLNRKVLNSPTQRATSSTRQQLASTSEIADNLRIISYLRLLPMCFSCPSLSCGNRTGGPWCV